MRYYDRGGGAPPHDERVTPLHLSDREVADLVSFLESLTGEERAGLGKAPAWRAETFVAHVQDVEGRPLPGRVVHVRPAGDRLASTYRMPAAFDVETDAGGDARFAFPASTHVVLRVGSTCDGEMVPDCASSSRLVVVPDDSVALRVRTAPGGTGPDTIVSAHSEAGLLWFRKTGVMEAGESLFVADRPRGAGEAPCSAETIDLGSLTKLKLDLRPGACNVVCVGPAPTGDDRWTIERARGKVGDLARALGDRSIVDGSVELR